MCQSQSGEGSTPRKTKPELQFEASHVWNAREGVIIREMENDLAEVSGEILVEVGEFKKGTLLYPNDVTGIVHVLAKNACHQEGHRRLFFRQNNGRNFGCRAQGSMRSCEQGWNRTARSSK